MPVTTSGSVQIHSNNVTVTIDVKDSGGSGGGGAYGNTGQPQRVDVLLSVKSATLQQGGSPGGPPIHHGTPNLPQVCWKNAAIPALGAVTLKAEFTGAWDMTEDASYAITTINHSEVVNGKDAGNHNVEGPSYSRVYWGIIKRPLLDLSKLIEFQNQLDFMRTVFPKPPFPEGPKRA